MIALDEDALICDLAETYGIINYRSLPVGIVAQLSVGLRAESRIKMKLNKIEVPVQTLLLAGILDKLTFLAWAKTTDGSNNINRPFSIVKKILDKETDSDSDIVAFTSGGEFDEVRKGFLKKG